MVYDALRTIMPIAGRDQRRRRSGAADPVSHRPRGGCSERGRVRLSPFAMSPKSSLGPSAAHSYKGSGLAKLTLLSVASAARAGSELLNGGAALMLAASAIAIKRDNMIV